MYKYPRIPATYHILLHTWEIDDSNSSGFSPCGLTILALAEYICKKKKDRNLEKYNMIIIVPMQICLQTNAKSCEVNWD